MYDFDNFFVLFMTWSSYQWWVHLLGYLFTVYTYWLRKGLGCIWFFLPVARYLAGLDISKTICQELSKPSWPELWIILTIWWLSLYWTFEIRPKNAYVFLAYSEGTIHTLKYFHNENYMWKKIVSGWGSNFEILMQTCYWRRGGGQDFSKVLLSSKHLDLVRKSCLLLIWRLRKWHD